MLTFALAVFFLLVTPGPGVLSTAGVGAAFGYASGIRYVLGLFIGTNLVALAVISGVAAVVLSAPLLRTVLLVASSAYLVYLAARIALSGTRIRFMEVTTPPGTRDGVLLQLINPKAYVVNTTLFTGFAFAGAGLAWETLAKLVIVNAIWIPIHLLWLLAGVQLKRLDLPANLQLAINATMALLMLGVVALAAASQLG